MSDQAMSHQARSDQARSDQARSDRAGGDRMLVRYEVSGGAARLTLDSQHNRNAISTALVEQLHAALERAAGEDAARVVVLGHAGGTFCAGADLSEASAAGPESSPQEQAAERTRIFLGLLRAIVSHPKPVIAAVDGHVRAGGMGLVAACDFALAGPASTFALTEVRLGLAAAMISVPLAAGILAPIGFVLPMSVGAILMSASTVVVALNAQLLRRLDLQPGASTVRGLQHNRPRSIEKVSP